MYFDVQIMQLSKFTSPAQIPESEMLLSSVLYGKYSVSTWKGDYMNGSILFCFSWVSATPTFFGKYNIWLLLDDIFCLNYIFLLYASIAKYGICTENIKSGSLEI